MIYDQYLNKNEYQDFVIEYNSFLDDQNGNDEVNCKNTETLFSGADTLLAVA
jgi:hypothetical protein